MSKITVTKALGDKFSGMRLRVGLFDVSDIALYAARHEFGVPSKNVPKRSFLLTPIKRDLPEISKKAKSLDDLGVMLVGKCQTEIRTEGRGQWKPFSENYRIRPSGKPVTDSSKLLRDTGALSQAITFRAEGA